MVRPLAVVVVVIANVAAPVAFAQADAGPSDAGPVDAGHCNDVTPAETQDGECETVDGGSGARFCTSTNPAQGIVAHLSCSNFELDDGSKLHGQCEVLDGIGAWCTFPEGTPCAFGDGAGGVQFFGCGTPMDDFS